MRVPSPGRIFLCLTLAACAGTVGPGSFPSAGAVHAAGFTARSVSGGYGFSLLTLGAVGSGVITADGNGNITAGEETANVAGLSCHGTLNGSYTVNADGSGAATMFVTQDAASSAKGCQPLATHFSLALTNGGQQILMAQLDNTIVATGIAIKQ